MFMLRITLVLIAMATLFPGLAGQAREETSTSRIQPLQRFLGSVHVSKREVRVAIHTWLIPNAQKIEKLNLPTSGFTVVELRGGSLVTIINGKREKRTGSSFWTAGSFSTMSIETEEDSAAIQTTTFSQ
jgi:hypothetical protein